MFVVKANVAKLRGFDPYSSDPLDDFYGYDDYSDLIDDIYGGTPYRQMPSPEQPHDTI